MTSSLVVTHERTHVLCCVAPTVSRVSNVAISLSSFRHQCCQTTVPVSFGIIKNAMYPCPLGTPFLLHSISSADRQGEGQGGCQTAGGRSSAREPEAGDLREGQESRRREGRDMHHPQGGDWSCVRCNAMHVARPSRSSRFVQRARAVVVRCDFLSIFVVVALAMLCGYSTAVVAVNELSPKNGANVGLNA